MRGEGYCWGTSRINRGKPLSIYLGMYYKAEYGDYQENSGFREAMVSPVRMPRNTAREKLSITALK